MKSRYIVTLLCCVLFFLRAKGQEVKDGYIVMSDGNYQYGVVQLDDSRNVYEECLFKADRKNEFTKFTPAEIEGYGFIDGLRFITKEIELGSASQKLFLKNESDGVVKLYSFKGGRFFVDKDNFTELKADAGNGHYKKVLSELLSDCKNISSTINKTALDLLSLQNLFLKYARCTSDEVDLDPLIRIEADFLAGLEVNSTTLKFNQPSQPKETFHLKDKTLLSVGINVLLTHKNNRQISYVTGVYYYDQRFYIHDRSVETNYESIDNINFDYREINIPIAVKYTFNKKEKKVMPYIKAGISIPITMKSTLTWENEKEYSTAVFFDDYDLPQKFTQSMQLGVSVGTTFTFVSDIRNVLEVTYQETSGEMRDPARKVSVHGNRIIILLGIRF